MKNLKCVVLALALIALASADALIAGTFCCTPKNPTDPGGIDNPIMPTETNCDWVVGFGYVCSGGSSTAPSTCCFQESYDSKLGVWYCTGWRVC